MTVLSYGPYNHAAFENTIDVVMRGLENPSGFVYGWVETWNISGILQADSLSDLLTKQDALRAAYKLQNQNVKWASGGDTIHSIVSANTLYGVRVVTPPTFQQGAAPGELVNRRRYSISLEAAYVHAEAASTEDEVYVLDYEQALSFTGTGGPTFGHLPTITGKFQKQQLTETSPVTCQQTGKRVGLNFTPLVDPPLEHLSPFEKVDRRQIRYGNPRRINNTDVEYPVFWTYSFERNEAFPTA